MADNPYESPQETAGREEYYDAALIHIVLICERCHATLDPDEDLGPGQSFHSDGYFVLLGDEAFRRGWKIESLSHGDFKILCPVCVRSPNS